MSLVPYSVCHLTNSINRYRRPSKTVQNTKSEDMGKQKDNGKKPSKKKGYDDVQISDLDEDDDKKDK
nr:unnamed protein product [Haemonchus contortus]